VRSSYFWNIRAIRKGEGEVASSVYSRTLQKAAELVGGRAKLCRALRVPAAELEAWIADKSTPPLGIFLRAVDLLIEESVPPAESEPGEPPAPRECSAAGDSSSSRY
jgi:hypothetical protein